jgi:hypothetical protein
LARNLHLHLKICCRQNLGNIIFIAVVLGKLHNIYIVVVVLGAGQEPAQEHPEPAADRPWAIA